MASNQDRTERWMERALGRSSRDLSRSSGTVFYEGDSIYSYGRHFEMARVMRDRSGEPSFVLVNGDRFSVTTSGHQSGVRGVIRSSGLPSIIVPYSAMDAAGIELDSIRPIQVREDRTETIKHESTEPPGTDHETMPDPSGATIQRCQWNGSHRCAEPAWGGARWTITERTRQVPDPNRVRVGSRRGRSYYDSRRVAERGDDGVWRWKTYKHWLGDSLFSARAGGRRRVFLSSFDYQEPGPLYFLAELPRGADAWSVDQAFQALKPEPVVMAEDAGLTVSRQGDIFAVPTTLTTKEVRAQTPYGKGRIVKRPLILGTNHEPSEAMFATGGRVYARGSLYHNPQEWGRERDHVRRRMGDGRAWHLLVRNTVPRQAPATARR